MRQAAFAPGHPYHRGIGGSPEQIASLSLADVCGFMGERYRPDNAILVVSGQFDDAAVESALEARYGTLSPVAAEDEHARPEGPSRAAGGEHAPPGPLRRLRRYLGHRQGAVAQAPGRDRRAAYGGCARGLIIVAPREQGLPLFGSIGIDSPRVVE